MTDETKNNRGGAVQSRRRLLTQAASALPFVATIPSGAALARSSNLINIASRDAAVDGDKIICLDTTDVSYKVYDSVVDLGVAPYPPDVTRITLRDYYRSRNKSGSPLDAYAVCENGGTVHFQQPGGWMTKDVPKGALVSATALASFYPYNITDI